MLGGAISAPVLCLLYILCRVLPFLFLSSSVAIAAFAIHELQLYSVLLRTYVFARWVIQLYQEKNKMNE